MQDCIGKRLVLILVIILTGFLTACAGEQWTGDGISQNTIDQDLESCYQMAHIRAQNEASQIKSSINLTPRNGASASEAKKVQSNLDEAYRKLREHHYETAKMRYKNSCMLEKGYHLE